MRLFLNSYRAKVQFVVVAIVASFITWGIVQNSQWGLRAASKSTRISKEEQVAIHSGADLERARKWLDAITHYKEATKKWPDNKEIVYGLRRAKIHFSVERRYADKSFSNELLSFSDTKLLGLLQEVIDKVHEYYVDKVNTTYFAAHGTESLYLALNNERFLKHNLPIASPEEIKKLRTILRTKYWNKPITHASDVQSTVREVCRVAKETAGLDSRAVILEYLFGGCNSLDDYSSYLSPGKLRDLYGNIEGEFVGLGVEMKSIEDKGIHLVNVLEDSPAEAGGLLPGDYIVAIDGVDTRKLSTNESAGLLTGPSGSRVKLVWNRTSEQDATQSATKMQGVFTRKAVKVKSIPLVFMADPENGIGYFRMTGFQKSSADELDVALEKLKRQGMKSIIWDLRGNPGGLLTAAVEVLDRFIDEGVLVSTRGRISDQNWKYTAHRLGTLDIPLVVLVDGNSASASEIVSGAVRDHQRGKLVGRKTYGKWSVQSIFPIRSKTGLRLSTAKFYSPNGHWYGKIGVRPDVEVEKPEKPVLRVTTKTLQSDLDFHKAIELLGGTPRSGKFTAKN